MSAAAFDFVRQLRDPELRDAMKAAGWTSGVTIVAAEPGEQVEDVLPRMAAGRNLYVVADVNAAYGWHMFLVDRTDGGVTSPDMCDRKWDDGHSCYGIGGLTSSVTDEEITTAALERAGFRGLQKFFLPQGLTMV